MKSKTSWNMRKFKPYDCEKASQVTRKFILERNIVHVRNVGKPEVTNRIALTMKKIRIGQKPFECNKCGKAFSQKAVPYYMYIILLILDRNPTNVRNVKNHSTKRKIFLPIMTFILERNYLNLMTVRKRLFRSQASLSTRKHIWEKNPINVKDVGKPSATIESHKA